MYVDVFPRNVDVFESHVEFEIAQQQFSPYLEGFPIDITHGNEPSAATTEGKRTTLDGPVLNTFAIAHVGELHKVRDAAPPVLADPAVAASLGLSFAYKCI